MSYLHTVSRLVGSILDNDIRLVVLEISQGKKNDVSLINPDLEPKMDYLHCDGSVKAYLLAHLSSNVCQSLLSIKALGLQASVSQHLCHLCILLSVFSKHQLSLVVIVLVLSTSPILSSL
jgi:hypothetical protein